VENKNRYFEECLGSNAAFIKLTFFKISFFFSHKKGNIIVLCHKGESMTEFSFFVWTVSFYYILFYLFVYFKQ